MKISLISAVAENRAIGKNNQLLWNIPEDMKHFREVTSSHTVIMGQKTYESIGRPLPNRTNIIVTFDREFQADDCIVCYSLDESFEYAEKQGDEEAFIIGGGSIYKQTIDKADRLYITLVKGEFDGDVFFPAYDQFSKIISRRDGKDENYEYSFLVLEKQ
jgi:dihydrofolate reductase